MATCAGDGRICGIYTITNTTSGKVYVGQSIDIRKRWVGHRNALDIGRHKNPHLQSAWCLYGEDNFKFAVVIECQQNELTSKEQLILDNVPMDLRYNVGPCVATPRLGCRHTPETIQRLREIALARPPRSLETRMKMSRSMKGRTVSEQTRIKLAKSQRGRIYSAESKDRMSESGKNRAKISETTRDRMRAAQRARWEREKSNGNLENSN